MQDPIDVICEAAKGFVEQIAQNREIGVRRMYEILGKDNPYPKAKRLIRDIGSVNPSGLHIIKADLDAMFAGMTQQSATVTVSDIHKESFEAIDAILQNKSSSEKLKELRELAAVVQIKIDTIERVQCS